MRPWMVSAFICCSSFLCGCGRLDVNTGVYKSKSIIVLGIHGAFSLSIDVHSQKFGTFSQESLRKFLTHLES